MCCAGVRLQRNMLSAILTLTGLGALFGLGLALAAKKFCVAVDPRLNRIYGKLPGVNCGACGQPGCMGFAECLIRGECLVEQCAVSDDESRQAIAKILGVEGGARIKKRAVLHCGGGSKRAKNKYIYKGAGNCASANIVMGGFKSCVYGCIGFGDCVKVCPFDALLMNGDDLPVVDKARCSACGKCVQICPKHLFSLAPSDKDYVIACKSLDTGRKVMQVCSAGCSACHKCETACPVKAIKIVDNLAVIDYDICSNCGECFKVCPTRAILKKEK